MPNKNKYLLLGQHSNHRGIIPFLTNPVNVVKAQIPRVGRSVSHQFVFVWRQLEFAFFGALTSVGALFCFYYKERMRGLKHG